MPLSERVWSSDWSNPQRNHSDNSLGVSNWTDANVETLVIDDDSFERELCKGKGGEWFRLQAGEDNCRDVIQCTTSVSQSWHDWTFIEHLLNIYWTFIEHLLKTLICFIDWHCFIDCLWWCFDAGFASHPLPSWFGLRHWEADLWLEISRQELRPERARAKVEAHSEHWWTSVSGRSIGLPRRHLLGQTGLL